MILETFPLLKFDFIGVFVNTWTADYNYPVRDCENLQFSLKCNYLKNKKLFLKGKVMPLMEFTSNFKHFSEKDGRKS